MKNSCHSVMTKMNELGKQQLPFLFIIDFLFEKSIAIPLNELDSSFILFDINGVRNYNEPQIEVKNMYFRKFPVSISQYATQFENVQSHLKTGNSYLVNLTCSTRIETNLSLCDIFYRSHARYKLLFDNFVVFSPEIFVQIADAKISTYPMKGTIDASIANAEHILLHDAKELAEHYTIVDLLRNDLSKVAKNVQVENFRYIEKITTNVKDLYQVSSKITGKLEQGYASHIGDLLFAMLPAGSVSGAPKTKTVDIICETETHQRGYYTGVCGIFDGNCLDSFVMIRFIEQKNNEMFYKSGGGITVYSNMEDEYNEMIDKVYVPIT